MKIKRGFQYFNKQIQLLKEDFSSLGGDEINAEKLIERSLKLLEETNRRIHELERKYEFAKNSDSSGDSSDMSKRMQTEEALRKSEQKLKELVAGQIAELKLINEALKKEIEERVRAEKDIKKSEAKFKGVFNSMVDVFSRSDIDGKCVMISPSIYKLLGYRPEEIIGNNLADFYARPEQRKEVVHKLKQSRKVENFEIDIVRKDGEIITVSTNAKIYYNQNGESLGIEGVFRDITEQKRAESEHDKLFNFSFDLLCIAGFDGYFKELNPAWEKMTGFTIEELKAKPFIEFIHKDDRAKTQQEIQELLKGGHSFNFENRYLTKGGDILHLSWTATPILENNLMYCIARDISEQKASERKVLEHQERLRDLTHELTISEEKIRKQIAADLHDHVGQMLASSRMQLSRITDFENNPEITKRINSVSQVLLKASKATRAAIFDLSPPQLSELGLSAAVHDWMKEQVEKKHRIQTSVTGDWQEAGLDEISSILLFRSIKELATNVVKHAGASHLNVECKTKGRQVDITVMDDGIGFDFKPELLKIKSQRYGLFSIQERIADLGGELIVNSEIGKGSKIKMTIPLKNNTSS